MHRPPHWFIAAERERHVRQPARRARVRQVLLDHLHALEEVDGVVVVLLDPRRDSEDVGIEDDVFRREADADQQLIGALRNLVFALGGVRLPLLVERHHDHGRAIAQRLARLIQELLLAFLHRDRVDDRLALNVLETFLDDVPFRRVHHDRNLGDVRLRCDQAQEGAHRRFGVEQALVHVHVNDLRAVLHLLARNVHGLGEIALDDQLLERRRTGDVRALTNVDEVRAGLRAGGLGHERLSGVTSAAACARQ